MMIHPISKNLFNYPPGTTIVGKWHKNSYTIIKKLGTGAIGTVYLVRGGKGYFALKMGKDSLSVTSEVNVLKAFQRVQGKNLCPAFIEMDDWEVKGRRILFYVMEYINGQDLLAFVTKKGASWLGVLMVQLLDHLHQIHRSGWVFGDLKPENLLVSGPGAVVRFIDVGGTTMQGRSIKEFTEFFDRGYWGLGTRKAEPTYDLFATAMMMIDIYFPQRFSKNQKYDGMKQLKQAIHHKKQLRLYEPVLLSALSGQYHSALEMKKDLLAILTNDRRGSQPKHNRSSRQQSRVRKRTRKIRFLETFFILLLISLLYAIYIFGQII